MEETFWGKLRELWAIRRACKQISINNDRIGCRDQVRVIFGDIRLIFHLNQLGVFKTRCFFALTQNILIEIRPRRCGGKFLTAGQRFAGKPRTISANLRGLAPQRPGRLWGRVLQGHSAWSVCSHASNVLNYGVTLKHLSASRNGNAGPQVTLDQLLAPLP